MERHPEGVRVRRARCGVDMPRALANRLGEWRADSSSLRTVSPLTPALSPLRGEGAARRPRKPWSVSNQLGEQDAGALTAEGRRRVGCSGEPLSLPSPLNGERIRRASSRLEPLNPVGTRSTASPSSALQSGTQWNASLPVPAGRFMERGENTPRHRTSPCALRTSDFGFWISFGMGLSVFARPTPAPPARRTSCNPAPSRSGSSGRA
jgi:hypothetical protein